MVSKEEVLEALRSVTDPELRKDLVELNMVQDISIDGDKVAFTLNLTTPACPLRAKIEQEARAAAASVKGVRTVEMKVGAQVAATHPSGDKEILKGVKNIIAVASGKGGVGKSTVTVNLALALAGSGAKVGILDADVYGPSIPLMMGVSGRPEIRGETIIPPVAHGLKVASLGFFYKDETPLVWRGPMVAGAVRQLLTQVDWGDLDYLVVDLPPGCLPAGTFVLTANNVPKPIEQIRVGEFVLSHDGEKLVPRRVVGVIPQGKQRVYRIRTPNRTILASGNHPFLKYHRKLTWRSVGQLKIRDRVIVANCIEGGQPLTLPKTDHDSRFISLPAKTTPDFMRVVGHFVGEGFKVQKGKKDPVGIRICEPRGSKFRETYESLYRKVFACKTFDDNGGQKFAIGSAPLAKMFTALDLNHKAAAKRVPDWIFGLPLDQRLAFIRGYSEADATIRHRETTKSLPDWRGLQRVVTIVQETVQMESTNELLVRQMHELCAMSGLRAGNVLESSDEVKKLPRGRECYNVTSYAFQCSMKLDPRPFKIARVTAIEPAGEVETYDLQVEEFENFVANGFVVHNTGDSGLTLAQTVPLGGVVIVTTPQEAALNIATKAVGMFRKLNVPILGMVENMSYFVCPHCLPPHQRIVTANGLVPISEVNVGDLVATHKGRYRRVAEKFERDFTGQMVEIGTKSARTPEFQLTLTEDHPILTRHLSHRMAGNFLTELMWEEAARIQVAKEGGSTDLIAFPRTVQIEDMERLEFSAPYYHREKKVSLPVGPDFMILLGYYLAEGSIAERKNRGVCAVRFTFGKVEKELRFAMELTAASSRLGFRPNLYKGESGWRVEISSVVLARWLALEFGRGAKSKRIPLWVRLLPPQKLHWLFESYLNGDGHRTEIESSATTISLQLAAAFREIGLKLGYVPSITVRRGSAIIQGRRVRANRIFRVGFTLSKRTRFDNDYVYLRVKNVRRFPYSGKVYNLRVEEDNSYCTPYQVVHNCGEKSFIFSSGGGRKAAAALDVQFLGDIPLHPRIREQSDLGVPMVIAAPDSPESLAFKEVAFRVAGMISMVAYNQGQ